MHENDPYRINVVKKYCANREIYRIIWNKQIDFVYNSAETENKRDLNKRSAFSNFSNVKIHNLQEIQI